MTLQEESVTTVGKYVIFTSIIGFALAAIIFLYIGYNTNVKMQKLTLVEGTYEKPQCYITPDKNNNACYMNVTFKDIFGKIRKSTVQFSDVKYIYSSHKDDNKPKTVKLLYDPYNEEEPVIDASTSPSTVFNILGVVFIIIAIILLLASNNKSFQIYSALNAS